MGGRSAVAVACVSWLALVVAAHAGDRFAVVAVLSSVPLAVLAVVAGDRAGSFFLLGALACAAGARGAASQGALERMRAAIPSRPCRLEVRVLEPPARESGDPQAVVGVLGAEPSFARGTRLRLRFPGGSRLEWGDRARALAVVDPPSRARNPGGYDARAAADASGIAGTGRALSVTRVRRGGPVGPRATAARWRRAVEGRLRANLTPRARELVVPLVTGDRSALSAELDARLKASGLVHLLALSGLHVAWLAAVARGLCAAVGGGLAARAWAGAACAVGYVALAGPLPSLLRAAAGELLAAVARLRGRSLDAVQGLAFAATALLVVAPGWARDVGFQLSCVATLGLATVSAWLVARAGRHAAWAAPLATTLGAQVLALPVLLARFHAVAWSGLLANLVAVPVADFLLASAWLGVAVDLAWPGCGRPFFDACDPLAAAFATVAGAGARLPHAFVSTGPGWGAIALASAAAALLAVALAPRRTLLAARRPESPRLVACAALGGLAFVGALAWMATARPLTPSPDRTWIVTLDVGQGDAIAVASRGRWWLVDAGPSGARFDAGFSTVLPFLRWAGVSRLEGVALTHDDSDHTGGADAVRHGVCVRRVFAAPPRPGAPGPSRRFGATTIAAGDTLAREPRVLVRWPSRDAASPPGLVGTADNDAGLVLEIAEGASRALLLADVDSVVEAALDLDPGLEVVKVAHHGSGSSSGDRFLHRARPRLAVISVGARNRFGHPDEGTIRRLQAHGAELLRTDRDGAIWLELDGAGARRIDWRSGTPRASAIEAETAPVMVRAPRRE